MTVISTRKFRIEGGSSSRMPGLPPPMFSVEDSALTMAHGYAAPVDSVLEEIRSLRAMVAPLSEVVENLRVEQNARRPQEHLQADIREIEGAIRNTKKELAAIKVGHNIGGADIAALELTTVVSQTEAAANDILTAAETIETLAGTIQSETTLEAAKILAGQIADTATTIYMSCNFQDLAGQRVSRVLDTLNFIEQRINRIIDNWGGLTALHEHIEAEISQQKEERASEGSAALLTGPVPVNAEDHVDQNAIDALFS